MFGSRVATGAQTGQSGSLMGRETVSQVAPGGAIVVPLGDHYLYDIGGDIVVQIRDSSGTWRTVSVASLVSSDGTNVRFFNGGAGVQTITSQKIG